MTTSAYPALVDQLLTTFTTAFPPATSGVYVGEGPGASDTGALKFIFVGVDSVDENTITGLAGSGAVNWATMGTNHSRDEIVSVDCIAQAFAGNQDPASRRNETFALFGAAITAVTTDPSLGRVGGLLYLQTYSWTYTSTGYEDGTGGQINFTLTFRARI